MKRLLAALLVPIAVGSACAGTSGTSGTSGTIGPVESGTCTRDVVDGMGRWADAGFSGSLALWSGDAAECALAVGSADQAAGTPLTVDTVFSIGSVSKAFTAAAVFALVEDEKMAVTDRAGRLLPDLAGSAADATVGQLLLHTSGLSGSHGNDHEPLTRDAAVAAISGLEPKSEAGTAFLYSNAGYTLLALIIEQLSGVTYREFKSRRVLPLRDGRVAGGFWDGASASIGPRAIGYLGDGTIGDNGSFDGPHWALDGNGDLAMTPRDLAEWTYRLFTGHVVSEASVDEIIALRFDNGDGTVLVPGWIAGDDSLFGEPFYGAAGGGGDVGHDAIVVWLPVSGRVIAIASNTPDVTAEDLMQTIGPALVQREPIPRPDGPPGTIDPSELAEVAGAYRLESGGTFDLAGRDGHLSISANGADAVETLFPRQDDFSSGDVARHEKAVMSLLEGTSEEGRDERDAIESDIGVIQTIDFAGTLVADGELRTFVTVRSTTESMLLWYALDESGSIAAVEGPTAPPTLNLEPSNGGYRPVDQTGTDPDVTVIVDVDDNRLSVTGPDGSTISASKT